MQVTATQLRKNVYKLLDQVLESGIALEVKRKGQRLIISPAEPFSRLSRLEPHPDCLVGDPEEYVHLDWSKDWEPRI